MQKIVVLSGAGISAESGIQTFRDSNGLWNDHAIEDVATPQAWRKNPQLVQDFYNARRKQLLEVKPNRAHEILAELTQYFEVHIITQNVDDLHERAGSKNVVHLHGELKKVRSCLDENYIEELAGWELKMGDCCPKGGQLRPHIVWFGEAVPAMYIAEKIVRSAAIFLVIGTSLNVYPAAGLIHSVPSNCVNYLIDPKANELLVPKEINLISTTASKGMELFKERVLQLIGI